jgi:tetratricopeptide (TPR) repeat protein
VQGAIDTISVVLFGLWLPFMALALACAERDDGEASARSDAESVAPARARRAAVLVACVLALPCAFVQTASSAVYASAAAPFSLPAHLPAGLGTRMYETVERFAPLPFVETALAEDALRRGDLDVSVQHAQRIPPGPIRADLEARAAAAHGNTAGAIRSYLNAGDDEALQPVVTALERNGRAREAYELERSIRDTLIAVETRPNALADSWWRLGRLAIRLGDAQEAAHDYERAIALAPLNTKYLLDAGLLELSRRKTAAATPFFARASEIDPTDADAVAGMGLAALQSGDVAGARSLAARAMALNARATLAHRLQQALR